MNIIELRVKIQNRVCEGRRVQYLVESACFEQCYSSAGAEEQKHVQSLIDNLKADALKNWIDSRRSYENMTIKQLREIATRLGIKNACLFDKSTLLGHIHERKGK